MMLEIRWRCRQTDNARFRTVLSDFRARSFPELSGFPSTFGMTLPPGLLVYHAAGWRETRRCEMISESLSDLIGAIYDTVLDKANWPDVLERSAAYVGGSAASIFSKSPAAEGGMLYCGVGIAPHFEQLYFERYVRLDPATTGQYFADIGRPIATADFIPYPEFLETRFYKEWAQPQGWVDFVSAVLDRSSTGAAMYGVFRHERDGVVDDETRQRMSLIIPHVRRAVLIGNVLGLKTDEAAAFADTLHGLAAGAFLVEENARIAFANAAGQAMLESRTAVRQEGGALVAVDSRAAVALREAIDLARLGDAQIGTRGIAIPLSYPPHEVWLAHVLPLTSGARRGTGRESLASAAVFVHQASLAVPSGIQSVSKLYRLTKAELRVLAAICEVSSVSEAAEVVGASEATVKTHLQRLFAKTGTNRQADLVKLVAATASPFRAEP